MESNPHIYGTRAVIEAIEADKSIDKIFLQKGFLGPRIQELQSKARKKGIRISVVPQERLSRFKDRNHQGVIASISPVKFREFQELIDNVVADVTHPLFLILDGVSDVRNFGAIIRTASCTGVDGIILPTSGSAPVTADTVKTSAGAVFSVPLARTPHTRDAVHYLQASGIQVIAATEKADQSLYKMDLSKGTAIVMGSEGKGVSPAVLKTVDHQAHLPMTGSISSLNVSVACGVFLYEVLRQRMG
ncbi:MAG: 23S rRNA (guanosine(2251)-2'-O)-methyltransferase RlmB [Robiginitalea sp.]|jgi:23S rRNA (guanosine2251-2'-O)-methyltransferase